MARFPFSTNHGWFRRQIQIDGRPFFHRQCVVYGRDFARPTDDPEWRAVQVGILTHDFLDDETTQRWASEIAPDADCRRTKTANASGQEEKCIPVPNVEPVLLVLEENPYPESGLFSAKPI